MIYDAQKRRYLSRTGQSVWTTDRAIEHLFENGELPPGQLIETTFDSCQYDFLNGTDCSVSLQEIERLFPGDLPCGSDRKDAEPKVLDIIESSPRYIEYPSRENADARLKQELNFYFENGYASFLLQLCDLVDRFKNEGVVWGVGRGSSCASFVLYVLEIQDIDPIEFDIDFRELSKEEDNQGDEDIE